MRRYEQLTRRRKRRRVRPAGPCTAAPPCPAPQCTSATKPSAHRHTCTAHRAQARARDASVRDVRGRTRRAATRLPCARRTCGTQGAGTLAPYARRCRGVRRGIHVSTAGDKPRARPRAYPPKKARGTPRAGRSPRRPARGRPPGCASRCDAAAWRVHTCPWRPLRPGCWEAQHAAQAGGRPGCNRAAGCSSRRLRAAQARSLASQAARVSHQVGSRLSAGSVTKTARATRWFTPSCASRSASQPVPEPSSRTRSSLHESPLSRTAATKAASKARDDSQIQPQLSSHPEMRCPLCATLNVCVSRIWSS